MNELEKAYMEWLSGQWVDQEGKEHVPSLIQWLKDYEDRLSIHEGYGFDCEVHFDSYRGSAPTIAFSTKPLGIHVFPWSDFISPNFIALSGEDAREVIQVLNDKVKKYFGLI